MLTGRVLLSKQVCMKLTISTTQHCPPAALSKHILSSTGRNCVHAARLNSTPFLKAAKSQNVSEQAYE